MTKNELITVDLTKTILVDIREEEELKAVPMLEGAVHVPMSTLRENINTDVLPKDKKIVTICRSGGRCVMLNQFLAEQGYDVDFLEGGMVGLKSS